MTDFFFLGWEKALQITNQHKPQLEPHKWMRTACRGRHAAFEEGEEKGFE